MAFLKTDQDYLDAGVEPPEHIPHSGTDETPVDLHRHVWRQIGNHLECSGGQHPHGHPFDHLNQILVGTSPEGAPILKALDFTGKNTDDGDNGDDRANSNAV